MAYFELNSDITIGKFRFSGVQSVQIKRSMHSIVDTAIIKIPSKSRITKNDKVLGENVITAEEFEEGDHVTIKLGYNGVLKTEFEGFVKRRNLNMPLEIECEGYSWLLRRNIMSGFKPNITLKGLLETAVSELGKGYTIQVQCEFDMSLGNIETDNKNGFDLVNSIAAATDNCLTCFFIKPNTLWCGLVYTPYANGEDKLKQGKADYALGYNTIDNNNLKVRREDSDPAQIEYVKRLAKGEKISQTSDVFKKFTKVHTKVLNHIEDKKTLKVLADEKAYRLSYSGYEGNIVTFLEPYVSPGYTVYIKDNRHKDKTGTYLVESTEVTFNTQGARRIVEIGPKVGFAKEKK